VFRIKSKLDRNDYQCRIINKKNLTSKTELQIDKEHYILRRMQEECIQKYYGTFETQD
jgi:calcium/calmodulin-dependent protein kinase I